MWVHSLINVHWYDDYTTTSVSVQSNRTNSMHHTARLAEYLHSFEHL